jgi:hypothetical protein
MGDGDIYKKSAIDTQSFDKRIKENSKNFEYQK